MGCCCQPSYRRALGILVVPAIIFYLLVAIGALTDVPGIYIESISAQTENGDVEVRVGYFGMCLQVSNGSIEDIPMHCEPGWNSYSGLVNLIKQNSEAKNGTVIEDLLHFASNMQHNIFVGSPAFFPGAGMLFLVCLLLLIPTECLAGPKSSASTGVIVVFNHLTITCFWLATGWSFAAALSTVEAVLAQQQVVQFDGSVVKVQIGVAVQALQWSAFFCTAFFAAGMTGLRISQGKDLRGLSRRAQNDWILNSANMMTSGVSQEPLYQQHAEPQQIATYPIDERDDEVQGAMEQQQHPSSPLSPTQSHHYYDNAPTPQGPTYPEGMGFHRASSFPMSPPTPAFRFRVQTPYPEDHYRHQQEPFRRNTYMQQSPTPMPQPHTHTSHPSSYFLHQSLMDLPPTPAPRPQTTIQASPARLTSTSTSTSTAHQQSPPQILISPPPPPPPPPAQEMDSSSALSPSPRQASGTFQSSRTSGLVPYPDSPPRYQTLPPEMDPYP